MTQASAHAALLLIGCLAALVATIVSITRRGARDDARHAISLSRIIWALWPFAVLACFEALQLRTSGILVAEWFLPALVTLIAEVFAASSRSARWIRRGMIATAVILTLHGGVLLSKDYVANPQHLPRGWQTEPRWYTPFTGIMPVRRPG